MKKTNILLLIVVCIFTFLVVYSPHIFYPLPFISDEWFSIQRAIELGNGTYNFSGGDGNQNTVGAFEIGFQIFLLILSKFVNLITFYKFLPALWSVFSALVLFYVTYKKTDNFTIGLFAMIFFTSIKSNTNILGLWFFIAMTFLIPFIFLLVYFFTEGVEKEKKKYIIISLFLSLILIFSHPISFTFMIPFLVIYSLFHYRYFLKEWKFFSLFLIVPIIGSIFYFCLQHNLNILSNLQFVKGWAWYEIDNSFFEVYSLAGYLLAIFGLVMICIKGNFKKYLAYILWPLTLLISMLIFKIIGVSYISPYQRNLYYFAIILPFFSAYGLYYIWKFVQKRIVKIVIISIVILSIFWSYYYIPDNIKLYHLIRNDVDYNSLLYLSTLPKGIVIAPLDISNTIFQVSGQEPVGTMWDKEKKKIVNDFNRATTCDQANEILKENNVTYILERLPTSCNWTLIYNKNNFIYKII